MYTPENDYLQSENSYELQVHPIKSNKYTESNYNYDSHSKHRTRHSTKRRRTKQFQLKCALSASIVILTVAASSMLYLLNTSADPWKKISSPSFFSDLEGEQQQLSTTDDLEQETENTDTASIQEGTVHIVSSSKEWNLILVNPWNPVPDDYEINLMPIQTSHRVDARCYPDLLNMLTDCSNAGLYPLICSSYRTQEFQQQLFDERVSELTAQGYNIEDAYDKAATSVATPGTSEHQIGLAVDIVDKNHQLLDSSQESTPVQQWLIENCWKYGFILRYPNGTSDLTGIIYEPWHYRYVGKTAAKEIHEQGICLEQYLAQQ